MEELIAAAPSRFDHAALFAVLQRSTLQHRMNDSFSCLVAAHTHTHRLKVALCWQSTTSVLISRPTMGRKNQNLPGNKTEQLSKFLTSVFFSYTRFLQNV